MAIQLERVPHLVCECGNDDVFHVLAFMPAIISVKQEGITHSDDRAVMVTDNTMCICDKCGKQGVVADFLDAEDAALAEAVDAAKSGESFMVGDIVGRA